MGLSFECYGVLLDLNWLKPSPPNFPLGCRRTWSPLRSAVARLIRVLRTSCELSNSAVHRLSLTWSIAEFRSISPDYADSTQSLLGFYWVSASSLPQPTGKVPVIQSIKSTYFIIDIQMDDLSFRVLPSFSSAQIGTRVSVLFFFPFIFVSDPTTSREALAGRRRRDVDSFGFDFSFAPHHYRAGTRSARCLSHSSQPLRPFQFCFFLFEGPLRDTWRTFFGSSFLFFWEVVVVGRRHRAEYQRRQRWQ